MGLVIIALQKDGKWVDTVYSEKFACPDHPHVSLGELEPRIFSFNSPARGLSECHGLGTVSDSIRRWSCRMTAFRWRTGPSKRGGKNGKR